MLVFDKGLPWFIWLSAIRAGDVQFYSGLYSSIPPKCCGSSYSPQNPQVLITLVRIYHFIRLSDNINH